MTCGVFSVSDTDVTGREFTQRFVAHTAKEPWLFVFKVLPRCGMELLGRLILLRQTGAGVTNPLGCHVALSCYAAGDSLPPHSRMARWPYLSLLGK